MSSNRALKLCHNRERESNGSVTDVELRDNRHFYIKIYNYKEEKKICLGTKETKSLARVTREIQGRERGRDERKSVIFIAQQQTFSTQPYVQTKL